MSQLTSIVVEESVIDATFVGKFEGSVGMNGASCNDHSYTDQ